jgi:hypothetical protein
MDKLPPGILLNATKRIAVTELWEPLGAAEHPKAWAGTVSQTQFLRRSGLQAAREVITADDGAVSAAIARQSAPHSGLLELLRQHAK